MTPKNRITIPGTDLAVSPLCLGGNRLGGQLDQKDSFALLDSYVEQGGNFIDSAHVYANWLPHVERSCSEKTLGRWLKARGGAKGVVIATKGGAPNVDAPDVARLDEASIRQDASEALENMGVDAIDLFYLHRDDPSRPVEEMLSAVERLRSEGAVRYYACSNWSGARIEEAAEIARKKGWPGFVANQPEWSLATRNAGTAGDTMIQMNEALYTVHRRLGLAAIPYSSQAKGYFDKALGGAVDDITAKAYESPENRSRAEVLGAIARRHGATPTQVMLNVMIHSPFPTIPIIGSRTTDQIASSFKALGLALSDAERAEVAGTVRHAM
ncbi:aldo/keto reductase [uncultured Alsobacter sp.]|uniref:aldo/keto reductase n=1 Tax=uncultured Alsobacter sp. TaxID=1748258 RepID=UPI0025FF0A53|nr:aldo/keto reductase [uncultured Alsobacter sp.]